MTTTSTRWLGRARTVGLLGALVHRGPDDSGVWVDERNRVFVADMFNGRVVVLQFLGGDATR